MDVPIFVRGLGGDWSDGPQNQMSYLGSGVFSIDKVIAAGANEFKIASSDWATVDCGGGSAGNDVTVGAPLAPGLRRAGSPNLRIAPASGGTYRFRFTLQDAGSGELLVTGP